MDFALLQQRIPALALEFFVECQRPWEVVIALPRVAVLALLADVLKAVVNLPVAVAEGLSADVLAQIILEPKRGSSKSVIRGVTWIKKQNQWCEQSSDGDANK